LAVRRDVAESQRVVRLIVAVKNLRREVEPVGPDDGTGICVDLHLGEVLGIVKGGYERASGLARDVTNVAYDTVVEQNPHDMGAKYCDPDY